MSYATVMVHVDAGNAAEKRVRLAAGVAERFRATLIGVAGRCYLPTFLADGGKTTDDGEQKEIADWLAHLGERFRTIAGRAGRSEWRGSIEYPNLLVPNEARAADLVVVGRDAGDRYFGLDPAAAILSCGRPVLVVPDGRDRLEASRVVVAWKEAREARRVVRDALPFLQEAKAVMIVEVCEPGTDARAQQQIDDVATYLQRHKVDVEAKAYLHTERTVAQELLRFAGDARADLVVAGGYGHSRLGELILGGVTRSLLADSAVCCMFSH